MEEYPSEELPESTDHPDSSQDVEHTDIRNQWTTASLSEPLMDLRPSEVFHQEGRNAGDRTRRRSSLRGRWKDDEESISLRDKASFEAEELDQHPWSELELHPGSSLQYHFEEREDYYKKERGMSSTSNISTYIPHRAYWTEQKNRLPLPLMELMENEALEILTKALKSYRSGIGRDHFMTKELQRYIEGLKRRRNRRLYCMSQ